MELELKNFNLFCGGNATGKTSVIHALLAAIQKNNDRGGLDGELIKIGTFRDVRTKKSEGKVEIEIKDNENRIRKIEFLRVEDGEETEIVNVIPNETDLNIEFEKDLFYLSSNRIGVVDTYKKGNYKFGVNGEAFVDFFNKYKNDPISSRYINSFDQKYSDDIVDNLEGHIRFWFNKITKENISVIPIPNTNQYVLTYGGEDVVRSINTGSGLSYIIPIITVCLGALINNEYPTLIIENPEIYLHPDAQIKLAEFLLFISKHAQLIIETHSDHILRTVMGENSTKNKVFVFELNNDGITKKTELVNTSFKTTPISYAEVQYKAFDLVTADLHALLYAKLHDNYQNGTSITTSNKHQIAVFDRYLDGLTHADGTRIVPSKNFNCTINGQNYADLTLLTFIRNSIDHPVAGRMYHQISVKDIKQSIDIMLTML